MNHNLKIFGLAFVAILAMSAVGASAASATPSYTCSSYPCTPVSTIVEGSKATFTNSEESAWFRCDASYTADGEGPNSQVTLTPHYTDCTIAEYLLPTFDIKGCDYVLTTEKRLGVGHYSHRMDIACPPEGSMQFGAGTCEARIRPQTGLGPVTTRNGSGGTVTLEIDVELTIDVTKDGFLCHRFNGVGHITRRYHDHAVLAGSGFEVSGE